jgi:hypothetical protein
MQISRNFEVQFYLDPIQEPVIVNDGALSLDLDKGDFLRLVEALRRD